MVGAVRTYTTSRKSIEVPTHAAELVGTWSAQTDTRAAAALSTSALVTIPTYELTVRYAAHRESLDDVVLGLDTIIREDQAEQIARAIGDAIINGTGSSQPTGIKDKAGIAQTAAGALITVENIFDLFYSLKTSYAQSGSFYMNRATISNIRQLKSDDLYVWTPGLGLTPNSILGRPVVETPGLDNEGDDGSANVPVLFGDLRRTYALAQRHGFRSLVDPYSGASSGLVDIYGFTRVGGDVVKTEACGGLIQ